MAGERRRRGWRRRRHLGVWDPTGGEARVGSGLPVEEGAEEIRVLVRDVEEDTREAEVGEVEALLASPSSAFWIDLVRPHHRARRLLSETLALDPLTVEDCLSPLRMPKMDALRDGDGRLNGAFVAAFAARLDREDDAAQLRAVEVDLVVGERYLVTVRDGPLKEVERHVSRRLREGDELMREAGAGAALAHAALDAMVDGHLPTLVGAASAAEELEERLDPRNERSSAAAFEALISLRRDLSAFRRLATAQQEALRRFGRTGDDDLRDHLDDVVDNQREAVDMADAASDYVEGAIETYRTRRDERTERGIRRLTGIAAILGVLTLFSGIYGMNFSYLPGAEDPEGFWIFVSSQVVFAVAAMVFLVRRGLL